MERPEAIEWIRKLRRLGQGDTPEAATARKQADKHMAKHGITEADMVAAEAAETHRESSDGFVRPSGSRADMVGDELLVDFAKRLRATLCSEGRKRGRFADHPHAEKILRARANGTTTRRDS